MAQLLTNACTLTRQGFEYGKTVVIEQGKISAIHDTVDIETSSPGTRDLQGAYLLPGFVDIQVNGGGGVLFNNAPTVDTIRSIGAAHRQFGTTGFLPTLISDDLAKVKLALAATREAIQDKVPGVLGIHLEGPFLNQEKKGIHDPAKFQVLDQEALTLISSLGVGKTLVTLAPETTTPAMIAQLAGAGVIVSAGHTEASFDVIQHSIQAGMTGFTHLFNAMASVSARNPGTVGAALDSEHCRCGVIVDGHHVHPAMLRLALAALGPNRMLLVTDAMPSVGSDQASFQLFGQTIKVLEGACLSENGTLAGSNLNMAAAVRNAVAMLALDTAEAVRMASQYPAEFLGLDAELGHIKVGQRANLVLADHNLQVRDTWIDGESS